MMKHLAVGAAVLGVASLATAGTTVYENEADFLAAIGDYLLEDFDGYSYGSYTEYTLDIGPQNGYSGTISAEGLVNSTSSRIHTRLDDVNGSIQGIHQNQAANNVAQQQEIDKLKLHFRYIMGIAAGVAVVLNFAKRIKELFFP